MPTLRDHIIKDAKRIIKAVNHRFADTKKFSTTLRPTPRQAAVVLGSVLRDLGLCGQVGVTDDFRLPGFRAVAGIRGDEVSLRLKIPSKGGMPVFTISDLIVETYAAPTPSIATGSDFASYHWNRKEPGRFPAPATTDAEREARITAAVAAGLIKPELMAKLTGLPAEHFTSNFKAG